MSSMWHISDGIHEVSLVINEHTVTSWLYQCEVFWSVVQDKIHVS